MPRYLPYVWLVLSVSALAIISRLEGAQILHRLGELEPTVAVLASFALIGLCSFISFYATQGTPIPSFVVAIALGIAGHELFAPVAANPVILTSLVTGGAAIVLFAGGLEMPPLGSFMQLFNKVVLLAIPGVLLTGLGLSFVVAGVSQVLGFAISPAVAILLGAILASTDPAAIIPALQNIRFLRRNAKDIVIAESAVSDVTGSLLTLTFLRLPLTGLSVFAAYKALATAEIARYFGVQVLFGVLSAVAAYLLLRLLSRIKRNHPEAYGADLLYFLGSPFIAFASAAVFGGSGFLAVFLAGLIFHAEEHMRAIEHLFNQVVDGVAKPIIFLLVGALVNINALIAYAPVGIAVALIFMFVLRPVMVFSMLGLYSLFPNSPRALSVRELLFISFVRETGAIPAVLLVTAVSEMSTPVDGLVEIGMWVILLTLILAPPLTPYVARRLGVAE
ncbi:MAG: cation:proton antiporter [Alphaproteobacteria bacterium]